MNAAMSRLISTDKPKGYIVTKEGWPFIGAGVLVALIGAVLSFSALFWLGTIWSLANIAFFRNPSRKAPTDSGLVVAGGDGKIIDIVEVSDPLFDLGLCRRVTTFLSVLDVHVNRAPISGTVKDFKYIEGRFKLAFVPEASVENERNAVLIEGDQPGEKVVMVQIAGTVARRIISYMQPGTKVTRGKRCGIIRYGSRVDIYLPLTAEIKVKVGDRVSAGVSVIAQFAKGNVHE